ncbi:PAS domain-containing sensor histidine kinase [Candidatus Parabeggiatoa sp. HSG14]|uniref:PAS domain-containing sensor histidine kinase n=1 Tax=Candidatus Parabeggiatoa sp. HSG14 TaxID=3055593 RepID=UPI0025A7921D|nr:PAS domain-containing sensor histidine kinase [Thiotrichales bacterium HSG14]
MENNSVMAEFANHTPEELVAEILRLKDELKKSDSNYKNAGKAFDMEKDKLKNIFEAIQDGIYIVNRECDIEYVNPVLEKQFGPYQGHKCYAYFHGRDEVCPWCKNEDVHAGKTVQWEWTSAAGTTFDLLDTPLKNQDGTISKLELFRDISDRKKIEDELKKSHDDLADRTQELSTTLDHLKKTQNQLVDSEKMASLGRLVAGFAHELNTPIGVAIGSASMLQRKAKQVSVLMDQEEVDVDELLATLKSIDKGSVLILSNLERAANLVTSFKRTAVDQTSDEARVFHVHQVLNDTINTLSNRFKKTDIVIQMDCPDNIKVKSLPGALDQIITNLLMNSFTHGFNEGQNAGIIQINIQLLDGEQLHLEYSDNGKGIASENLEKIFEPFFTTHRAHGGSGLGMYICYNLVTTQLHGTLTCESIVSEGVVFKIDYPIEIQK